jgi:hypothetical protein
MAHTRRGRRRFCRGVALSIMLLVASACVDGSRSGFTPTPFPVVLTAPSITSEATPHLGRTAVPVSLGAPTSMPVPTPSRGPEASWTPLSTLSPTSAVDFVTRLLGANGGCRLPCWWGLEPGTTTWQAAQQMLSTFADRLDRGDTGYVSEGEKSYLATSYSFSYHLSEQLHGGAQIGIWNGIVTIIYVSPGNTLVAFKLHQVLEDYGKPEAVLLQTTASAPEPHLPFLLLLDYRRERFMVAYETEAEKRGDTLRGCPQAIAPSLWVWSPDLHMTDQRMQFEVLGVDLGVKLRSLEEVTGTNVDAFYQTFKEPNSPACIETPASLW